MPKVFKKQNLDKAYSPHVYILEKKKKISGFVAVPQTQFLVTKKSFMMKNKKGKIK